MESSLQYVMDGLKITSKPPRNRSQKNVKFDSTLPEETTSSLQQQDEWSLESEIVELEARPYEFAYLDHPADVIITGSGKSIGEALEAIALGMYSYMTDLSLVVVRERKNMNVKAITLSNLLFHFLDECLYLYSSEYFIAKYIRVCDEIDVVDRLRAREPVNISFILYGDRFNPDIHTSGTEVKAITYHEMKIEVAIGEHVIVLAHDTQVTEEVDMLVQLLSNTYDETQSKCRFKLFTLVDI